MATIEHRPGRTRSQTTPAPASRLYRIITPIDHLDTVVIDDHDHNPADESQNGTPRTSLTLVHGEEGDIGTSRRRQIDPVEELHEDEPEGVQDGAMSEKHGQNGETNPDQKLTRREPYHGGETPARAHSRRQSLTRKITGTLRPSISRANDDESVPAEKRQWKDDIVTFDSKVGFGIGCLRPLKLTTDPGLSVRPIKQTLKTGVSGQVQPSRAHHQNRI